MFIMKIEKNKQKFNEAIGIVGLLASAYLIMKSGEDKGFSNGIVTGQLLEKEQQEEETIIELEEEEA